jgi:hypothetical protein
MEIGEGSQPPKTPEQKKPGTLKVLVRAKHDKTPVEGADVSLGKKKLRSDSSGIAEFDGLSEGGYNAKVYKAFPAEKHVRFITHYPKVTISYDAESHALAGGTVKGGETTEVQADIEIYRPLVKVVLERRHIDFGGEDKYGHWWTVVDDTDSYGWWPKYPVGHPNNRSSPPPAPPPPLPANPSVVDRIQHRFNAIVHAARSKLYSVKESSLVQTFRGVEGELNGCTSFGGRAKRYGHGANLDPHFMGGDTGNDRFQPVLHDERVDADIKALLHKFADDYTGGWAWRFEAGQNCHSFQIAMMNACNLKDFKNL